MKKSLVEAQNKLSEDEAQQQRAYEQWVNAQDGETFVFEQEYQDLMEEREDVQCTCSRYPSIHRGLREYREDPRARHRTVWRASAFGAERLFTEQADARRIGAPDPERAGRDPEGHKAALLPGDFRVPEVQDEYPGLRASRIH